jgi:hypothetical protein
MGRKRVGSHPFPLSGGKELTLLPAFSFCARSFLRRLRDRARWRPNFSAMRCSRQYVVPARRLRFAVDLAAAGLALLDFAELLLDARHAVGAHGGWGDRCREACARPAGRGRQRMGGDSLSSGQTASHVAPQSGHWRSSSHSAMSTACQRITESSSMVAQSGRLPHEQPMQSGDLLAMGAAYPKTATKEEMPRVEGTKSRSSVYTGGHVSAERHSSTRSASAVLSSRSATNRPWRPACQAAR